MATRAQNGFREDKDKKSIGCTGKSESDRPKGSQRLRVHVNDCPKK
jgi:hypothetical protein